MGGETRGSGRPHAHEATGTTVQAAIAAPTLGSTAPQFHRAPTVEKRVADAAPPPTGTAQTTTTSAAAQSHTSRDAAHNEVARAKDDDLNRVWAFSALPPTVPRHPRQLNLYQSAGMYKSPKKGEAQGGIEMDEEKLGGKYQGLPISTRSKRGDKQSNKKHSEDETPKRKMSKTTTRSEPMSQERKRQSQMTSRTTQTRN